MRIIIIVQARMGSERLPGKVLKEVLGRPLLSYLLERLKFVSEATEIVVATTVLNGDDAIENLCQKEGVKVFRGSSEDVLERYYLAAKKSAADVVVRITGDCPCTDPKIIGEVITFYTKNIADYVSNTLERTFPIGMDVEVFSMKALERAYEMAKDPAEREHVTPYIYRNPQFFSCLNVPSKNNYSNYRLTVDTSEDFELIRKIIETLYPVNPKYSMNDIISLLHQHSDWILINAHVKQKKLEDTDYQIVPLRHEDMMSIRKWRNEQIEILRQNQVIQPEEQEKYYREVIVPNLHKKDPDLILYSILYKGNCIGYGGFVHLKWDAKTGEVSFLLETERSKNIALFKKEFGIFLDFIKKAAVNDLKIKELHTETYDIRPHVIEVLEKKGFVFQKRIKDRVTKNGRKLDALFHSWG